MISADPSQRWDGQQWWHWDGHSWRVDPDAEPPAAPEPRSNLPQDRSDIRSAAAAMRFRGKTSRALKHLPGAIAQDEVVEFILAAEMGGDPGVLVLTSDRLLFIGNARTDWALRSASVGQITGALVERGTMRHTVTVALDDGALILTTVDRPAADAFAGLLHVRLAGHVLSCVGPAPRAAPAPAPATPATTQGGRDAAETPADPATAPIPGVDAVTAMAQLRKLLDLGLITESEFERKKAEILDRL